MASTSLGRPAQRPILPWEVSDIIIDYLHHDVRTLGSCGAVCSEWVSRSRYHLFSTVQLWPWRMREFMRLADSSECTFSSSIRRIEVDDGRERARKRRDGRSPSTSPERRVGGDREEPVMFAEAMRIVASHKCLAQVTDIEIRNVDWTLLRPKQRTALRAQLCELTQLQRLEFHDVVFQDMREVARIVAAFPLLHHITANVSFAQYLEHTLAADRKLPAIVQSLALGTDDGIPAFLNAVEGVRELDIKNANKSHLQCIHGTSLEKLYLHLKSPDDEVELDLSTWSALRALSIGGLHSRVIEHTLPAILSSVEAPFLQSVHLQFILDTALALPGVDWAPLEKILLGLHFFGMSTARIECTIAAESPLQEEDVERWVRASMPDLDTRGALVARASRTKVVEVLVYDEDDMDVMSFPGDKTVPI